MIPFTLVNDDPNKDQGGGSLNISNLSTAEIVQLLQLGMALLSICCMILLGFQDDVLGKPFKNLHKLPLGVFTIEPFLKIASTKF